MQPCTHVNTDLESLTYWEESCVCSLPYEDKQIKFPPPACVPQSRAEGVVECGDMLQQMAHLLLLILLVASFHSSATCGGGHTLAETGRPPRKSRMQVIYHERSRSPQIKVCCESAWFSRSQAGSAHQSRLNECKSHGDTDRTSSK